MGLFPKVDDKSKKKTEEKKEKKVRGVTGSYAPLVMAVCKRY